MHGATMWVGVGAVLKGRRKQPLPPLWHTGGLRLVVAGDGLDVWGTPMVETAAGIHGVGGLCICVTFGGACTIGVVELSM